MEIKLYHINDKSSTREMFDSYYKKVLILYPKAKQNVQELCFWAPEELVIKNDRLPDILTGVLGYLNNVSHAFDSDSKIELIAIFEVHNIDGGAYILFAAENESEIKKTLEKWWTKRSRRFAEEEVERRLEQQKMSVNFGK